MLSLHFRSVCTVHTKYLPSHGQFMSFLILTPRRSVGLPRSRRKPSLTPGEGTGTDILMHEEKLLQPHSVPQNAPTLTYQSLVGAVAPVPLLLQVKSLRAFSARRRAFSGW